MVKFDVAENGTYTAGEAIATANLRVKLTSAGTITKAGVSDGAIGTAKTIAASGDEVAVRYPHQYGTMLYVASEAIEVGDAVVPAAAGKVANGGEAGVATGMIGIAASAATADGNIIEVLTVPNDPQGTPVYHYTSTPAAAAGVMSATAGDTSEQTIASPGSIDVPRNLVLTIAGTAGDVKAGDVVATGLDYAGDAVTETFTLTVNTAEVLTGAKAFASISSLLIPAQDGTGCTFALATGEKLGLHHKLPHNTVIPGMTFLGDTVEGTDPTVVVSSTVLASNTADLNSATDGSTVDLYYIVTT